MHYHFCGKWSNVSVIVLRTTNLGNVKPKVLFPVYIVVLKQFTSV